jgi:hypothetical protein
MIKWFFLLFAFSCKFSGTYAQGIAENIVIITLDGMRWQEVFKGVDTVLMADTVYSRNPKELKAQYGGENQSARRSRLMPFLWSVVAKEGQLYGNRAYDNKVNNANPYWFSYPGYNEIFTGNPDTSVNSNDKIYNKYVSVLEYLNTTGRYQDKVAVFSTWDAFPFIFNQPRSHIFVNADTAYLKFTTPRFNLINDLQRLTTKPLGVRPDVITYLAAKEYLLEFKPKVLYIAFDETDDFAHAGLYDQYISSAHAEDAMIEDLWKTLQSLEFYKGKTTLLITTDHGRGDKTKSEWRHHGQKISDASEIWIAALGPGIQPSGEIKSSLQLFQAQLATTIAIMLGIEYKPLHGVYPPIDLITGK